MIKGPLRHARASVATLALVAGTTPALAQQQPSGHKGQESGKIHFQNCHRLKSFLQAKTPWFSCSLNDVKGVHLNQYKGNASLLIVTQTGSATISSNGSNFMFITSLTRNPAL